MTTKKEAIRKEVWLSETTVKKLEKEAKKRNYSVKQLMEELINEGIKRTK